MNTAEDCFSSHASDAQERAFSRKAWEAMQDRFASACEAARDGTITPGEENWISGRPRRERRRFVAIVRAKKTDRRSWHIG